MMADNHDDGRCECYAHGDHYEGCPVLLSERAEREKASAPKYTPATPHQLCLAGSAVEMVIPDLKIKTVILEPGELIRLRSALISFSGVGWRSGTFELLDHINVADVRFMEDK